MTFAKSKIFVNGWWLLVKGLHGIVTKSADTHRTSGSSFQQQLSPITQDVKLVPQNPSIGTENSWELEQHAMIPV